MGATPVEVSPSPVDMGTLRPGTSGIATMFARNTTRDELVIARVETSCPCIRFEVAATRLEPGAGTSMAVFYDPGDAPDYRGGLSVECIGRDVGGILLFRCSVRLEVAGPL